MPYSAEVWAKAREIGCHPETLYKWRKAFGRAALDAVAADFKREKALRAHARTLGLTPNQVFGRQERGWTLREACTTPPLKHWDRTGKRTHRQSPAALEAAELETA